MKQIALTGKNGLGKFALVDDEDFEYLNRWKWHVTTNGYVRTYDKLETKQHIFMHRVIIKIKTNRHFKHADHINMNKLDNRKENLRIATPSQNLMNRLVQSNKSNKIKGVYWDKSINIWKAMIGINGKNIYLGSSYVLSKAIEIRNMGVKKYHGEFGRFT